MLLEAIAGPEDLLFPVRERDREIEQYSKLIEENVNGVKIGIVKEGFPEGPDHDEINQVVKAMIEKLRGNTGVIFEDVSVPEHIDGGLILGITANTEYALGIYGNAQPYTGRHYTMPDMASSFKDIINNQNEYGKMSLIWDKFYNRHFASLNLMQRGINRMSHVRR